MVLRRCKLILVVDAGQDFKYVFEDVGNAIRKIRIDLGIPIDIRVVSPKKSEGTVNHCAFGTIKYSAVDGPGPPKGSSFISNHSYQAMNPGRIELRRRAPGVST